MKIAVLCSFAIFLSIQFCCEGRRRTTNIDRNGINHQRGRHNTNVNVKGINYNYRGNQWNTNINHNVRSGNTRLNANYRKNHNFFIGHNAKNRHTQLGYQWKFGRRRRSIEATDEIDLFKPEKDPKVFFEKLALLVEEFVQEHRATVPELETLSSVFDNNHEMISNVTVAKVVVCLVRKFQRILPKTLGNFIVKMIKFHGPSFNINNLSDFFHVDAAEDKEGNVHFKNEKACELPKIKGEVEQIQIESGQLLEIKKFVASLVKVGMEYQLLQENK